MPWRARRILAQGLSLDSGARRRTCSPSPKPQVDGSGHTWFLDWRGWLRFCVRTILALGSCLYRYRQAEPRVPERSFSPTALATLVVCGLLGGAALLVIPAEP